MDQSFSNTIGVLGTYKGEEVSLTSNTLNITLVDGLTLTLSADKTVWVNGNLTFTLVINNEAEDTLVSPTVTDVLDITLVDFVDNSVTIDGEPAQTSEYNYDSQTGTLTVTPGDVATNDSSTITFQVSKKVS